MSLWLDMPSPGSAKSGYQLSWTVSSGSTYTVKLVKWTAGSETVQEDSYFENLGKAVKAWGYPMFLRWTGR